MYYNFTKKLETSAHHRSLFGVTITIFIIVLTALAGGLRSEHKTESPQEIVIVDEYANPFEKIELQAQAAFVWDIARQEVLYAYNEETQLPLASIAKVMTALVVIESLAEDTVVAISAEAIRKEGDSGLLVNERWNVKDLIDFTLVTSSNDGAAALAQVVSSVQSLTNIPNDDENIDLFSQRVSEQVAKIGMNQTFFINESGLDISEGLSGAYSSAYDIARLFSYVITKHPSLLEATTKTSQDITSLSDFIHPAHNTNHVVESFPSALGSKTGFTDMAGGNLAVAFEAGPQHPIVAVVLGSTQEDRFTDIEKLIWSSLHYMQEGVYDDRTNE